MLVILLSETNKKPGNLSQIITSSFSTKEDRSTSKMAAPYPCIKCKQEVRPRQEALLCDSCDEWQHRTCNSGITRNQYCQAVKDGADIKWQCTPCRLRQDSTTPGPSHEASSDADTSMPSFIFVTKSDSFDSNINMGVMLWLKIV